jgi:hypothetical protein
VSPDYFVLAKAGVSGDISDVRPEIAPVSDRQEKLAPGFGGVFARRVQRAAHYFLELLPRQYQRIVVYGQGAIRRNTFPKPGDNPSAKLALQALEPDVCRHLYSVGKLDHETSLS